MSPFFVAGVEADIQASSLRGEGSVATLSPHPAFSPDPNARFLTTVTNSRSLNYLGTLRGRIGVTFTPSLLAYATGGLAYGGVRSTTNIVQVGLASGPFGPPTTTPEVGTGSVSKTRTGYTLGAGLDWMFLPNWSAKLEYLYYDLGRVTYSNGVLALNVGPTNFAGSGIASITSSSTTRFSGHVVRAGINYHFNLGAPGPLLAAY